MATKDELKQRAEAVGVEVPSSATKDEIEDALAGSGVAPVEGSLSDAPIVMPSDGHDPVADRDERIPAPEA